MPTNPNKLSQFWQELKRRKVVRVITVYGAAAFVILELVDIITEPFGLPDWTLKLVVVLLSIGLIVSIILSWIYDIHPEGGIVKTEPADKVKEGDIPNSSNSWRIASYFSFVVIVGLIVLNVIPRSGKVEILEKSIAVLPFRNDSPDEETRYFINGTMEAILDNLCKVEELRVPGRTSVEQYRDVSKAIPIIAKELGVSYILEGSGQKLGNRILLTVQLLDGATDKHLWSEQYDRRIESIEELIDIYSEIAQLVAGEIEAIITPEEEQLIEKKPTNNLTAYDYYQRGREEYMQYRLDYDWEALERAEVHFNTALEYDSTYAQAYAGLASVYWSKRGDNYLSENYLDTVLSLANTALSYDDQLADAYTVKGQYYWGMGEARKANEEFDKALQINPNDYGAYRGKGVAAGIDLDYAMRIYYYNKAALVHRGPELPGLLRGLGTAYRRIGLFDKNKSCLKQALMLDGDSVQHYFDLAIVESYSGNFKNAIDYGLKGLALDSLDIETLYYLGRSYLYLGDYEESLTYFEKYIERFKALGYSGFHRPYNIGCAYWRNGNNNEAEYYFGEQKMYCEARLGLNRQLVSNLREYYELATVYAFLGEKEKVYENLRIYSQRKVQDPWHVIQIKDNPVFVNLRDEPEFQQIVREVEAKYQAEHERAKQWLEENDML